MTSRECVLANLERANPERPGMSFSGGRMNDFASCGVDRTVIWTPRRWVEGEFEYYDDPWGCIWWRKTDGCAGGEVHEAAIKDWSQLKTLKAPAFDDPRCFEKPAQVFAENPDKFKLASMPGWVFATSRYLRKMEIYFGDLIEYREELDRLHTIVTDMLVKVIHRYAEIGAEGIFYCEDLGVQDRTLVSPAMWRDVFRPHYLRLTGAAHEHGMKVFMHSCGYNWALIDDLMDAGVDVFQFDQPANYDMPALAAKLRARKVALYSPVDIQKVLPTGDKALIQKEARRMVETFKGGLICKNYGDLKGIGVQPEWDQWAYEAILDAAGIAR